MANRPVTNPNFSFEAAGKSLIRLDKAGVEVVSY